MVSCGVIQCQVNYFGDVFTSTLHMHPCDPEFNFVWGFNRSSTDLNVGYLVNATEGFFVKDLSVTVPPIGASTIFALANWCVRFVLCWPWRPGTFCRRHFGRSTSACCCSSYHSRLHFTRPS